MTVDVKIFELTPTTDELESQYRFRLERGNGYVSGVDGLTQMVVKALLTTPGTDKFNQTWGGGLNGIPPVFAVNREILSEHRNNIHFAVSKVEGDIRGQQSIRQLPLEETLLSIEVVGLSVDDELEKTTLSIRITTADKQARVTTVEL